MQQRRVDSRLTSLRVVDGNLERDAGWYSHIIWGSESEEPSSTETGSANGSAGSNGHQDVRLDVLRVPASPPASRPASPPASPANSARSACSSSGSNIRPQDSEQVPVISIPPPPTRTVDDNIIGGMAVAEVAVQQHEQDSTPFYIHNQSMIRGSEQEHRYLSGFSAEQDHHYASGFSGEQDHRYLSGFSGEQNHHYLSGFSGTSSSSRCPISVPAQHSAPEEVMRYNQVVGDVATSYISNPPPPSAQPPPPHQPPSGLVAEGGGAVSSATVITKRERQRPPKSKRMQGKMLAELVVKAQDDTEERREQAEKQFMEATAEDPLLSEYARKVLRTLRSEAISKEAEAEKAEEIAVRADLNSRRTHLQTGEPSSSKVLRFRLSEVNRREAEATGEDHPADTSAVVQDHPADKSAWVQDHPTKTTEWERPAAGLHGSPAEMWLNGGGDLDEDSADNIVEPPPVRVSW